MADTSRIGSMPRGSNIPDAEKGGDIVEIQLTKDADKSICLIYKEYLDRRKSGLDKKNAKDFFCREQWPAAFVEKSNLSDFLDTIQELQNIGFVRRTMGGGFYLEDAGILYMEQRFPDGVAQVLDWLAKIKSAIPFA